MNGVALTLAVALAAPAAAPTAAPEAAPPPAVKTAPAPSPEPAPAPAAEPAPASPATAPAPAPAPAPMTTGDPAPGHSPLPTNAAASQPAISMSPRAIRMRAVLQDATLHQQYKQAQRTGNAGVIVGSIGIGVGLLVALPAWSMRQTSLERAEEQTYRVDLDDPLDEAQRRLRVFQVSIGIAGTMFALGTTLAILGYSRRARILRSAAPSVAITPTLGGAAATVRF